MKLTVRETKKAIKNNQTVKFTLERNNARELTSNKKYYKRYVKAIVKTIKSFYPALDSSYILSELERYEILPNISRFDEEGYLIRYGKQRYVTAQTFEVTDNKIYWVDFDYNSKYFVVDEYLGMKLDNDVAVSDPFTNHFAILANDPNVLFHVTDEELLPLFLKLSMKSNGTFNIAVDESFEYLARAANKKDTGRDLILTIRKGLGKLEYKIKKLTYEYEGQGKNIKVKELELSENSDNEAELKVIFERSFSILEKIYNYSKAQVNHTLKSYKDKRAELKRFNQQELENLIKNNTKEKEDFN